jgi:Concanavalin A-like lectin/glucanases superfamily
VKSVVVVLSATLFLSISCRKNNPVEQSLSTGQLQTLNSGLVIGFSMKDAPQEIASIVGVLSRSGYDTLKNYFAIANDSATCDFHNIAPGIWHLTVNAYDTSNVLKYSGGTDVEALSGTVTPVNLELDPVTGSIHVMVTWGPSSNKSLKFDGFSGYVEMNASSSLSDIDSALTLEAWVKPQLDGDNSRYYNYIICNGVASVGYTMELLSSSLNPAFTLNGLTIDFSGASDYWSRLVINNNAIPDETWTHLAVTYKYDEGINIYINGELVHHANSSGLLSPSNQNLRLGVLLNDTYQLYFKGLVDEVRIWKIARTQTEITGDMNKELTGAEPGLVGYWNCNDPSSSLTLHDKSIYNNTGTLHGGVSFSSDTPF